MLSVLVDTNIALDYALHRGEWGDAAHDIFESAIREKIQLVFSATSLKDLYFVTRKTISEAETLGFIDFMMDICTIGDVTADVCRQARAEREPDFEDCIVAAVAREQAVDIIISRDEKAFNNACAPKVNSRQFVNFFLKADPEVLFFEQDGESTRQLA